MDRGTTSTRNDFTIEQDWERYTPAEHGIWRTLFERQARLLPGRAADEYVAGLEGFGMAADGIPDFRRLNDVVEPVTGWRIVAVPGLVPDDVFFDHLANKRFPSTCFIRTPEELDYIQEPDVFHDVFGHVPLLLNPVFADFMQAYGRAGLAALGAGALHRLARLYWYTVEFGLIATADGLRIYGAGIVSSPAETVFSLESPSPNRVGFELERLMRIDYRIDDFQETYFVIDDYATLFAALDRDLRGVYPRVALKRDLAPGEIARDDHVLTRGTGAYAAAKRAA